MVKVEINSRSLRFGQNRVIIENDICRIELYDSKGEIVSETIYDFKFYQIIKDYRWYLNNKGYVVSDWHDENNIKHQMLLHAAIIELSDQKIPFNYEIDHKDLNKLNNLENNLRICTHSQNCQNRGLSSANTSGFIGVYLNKQTNRCRAIIKVNRKPVSLGTFATKEEAARAYNAAAIKYFGEFAVLNDV